MGVNPEKVVGCVRKASNCQRFCSIEKSPLESFLPCDGILGQLPIQNYGGLGEEQLSYERFIYLENKDWFNVQHKLKDL